MLHHYKTKTFIKKKQRPNEFNPILHVLIILTNISHNQLLGCSITEINTINDAADDLLLKIIGNKKQEVEPLFDMEAQYQSSSHLQVRKQ
jgi:hypothetical protein